MSIKTDLLKVVSREWKRWGFSSVPVHGPKTIGGKENEAPYVDFVNEYWSAVKWPDRNGRTPLPWSAAFISYCFEAANSGTEFPYNEAHWGYCAAILKKPNTFPGFKLMDPAKYSPLVGDLIWAGRAGGDCPFAPKTFDDALRDLKKGRWFCSHADIVIARRDGEVDVVGGNVADSVTKSTYTTVKGKISDPRHSWLAVIKNDL